MCTRRATAGTRYVLEMLPYLHLCDPLRDLCASALKKFEVTSIAHKLTLSIGQAPYLFSVASSEILMVTSSEIMFASKVIPKSER